MVHLYELLAARVDQWRANGYPCEQYPVIAEVLLYQRDPDTGGLRYLRAPQMRALETYWYLRLVAGTPHVSDLYKLARDGGLFAMKREVVDALGIPKSAWDEVDTELDELFRRVETDDDFVERHRLETVRETLTLPYPSYILALAMGAGKTVVIGSIIATEFTMALEYPDGGFVQNALVFAPPSGKTILLSLRELSEMPYDRILPPRLYNQFSPNLKITFTRDGERDVPVVRGSRFNVVVTNVEKIRIQKESIRKSDFKGLFAGLKGKEEEARTEIANLRLQTIASLPHLAVFSDEAHHTYGQSMGEELKKVRLTVNYLNDNTNVVCVVNTTGTPYFQRQPLKDVVIWYGLSEGIRDGILKEVRDRGIQSYIFDPSKADIFVREVVRDFFHDYADVRLPNGAPAKLAMYFPQTDDLEELRPVVERTLLSVGQDPSLVLRNTNESTDAELDAFRRLNEPDAPHRVILLVNKGTEGWNCPSLFACALARKLRSSNNFVLQASTRCLRQVPGNAVPARVYLSADNRSTLESQLQETYGETLATLDHTSRAKLPVTLRLRKFDVAPLVLRVPITVIRRKQGVQNALLDFGLRRSASPGMITMERSSYGFTEPKPGRPILQQEGATTAIAVTETTDTYLAAVELAARYRLDPLRLRTSLLDLYPEGEIPDEHLYGDGSDTLPRQLEALYCDYEQTTEYADMTLALVKKDGWKFDPSNGSYTTVATFDEGLTVYRNIEDHPHDFGFHYEPYRFDSGPEKNFFLGLMRSLRDRPGDIEDVYFTGGITDPKKTDFFIEYTDADGGYHRYTPDFIIRRKPRPGEAVGTGSALIVEIKMSLNKAAVKAEIEAHDETAAKTVEARKALATLRLVGLNRGHGGEPLAYDIIFDDEPLLSERVRRFLEEALS